jgi:hypothetical protein
LVNSARPSFDLAPGAHRPKRIKGATLSPDPEPRSLLADFASEFTDLESTDFKELPVAIQEFEAPGAFEDDDVFCPANLWTIDDLKKMLDRQFRFNPKREIWEGRPH